MGWARYLRTLFLVLLLAPSGALTLPVDAQAPRRAAPRSSTASPDLATVADLVERRTNAFRQEHGRAPVVSEPSLSQTAQDFASYMARTDRYGHGADGLRPSDRAEKHGYAFCSIAENIAYQFSTAGFTAEGLARGFVEGWKESRGHRENMLDPDVTQTGVAVARSSGSGYFYAVQLFGRPASARVRFRVANRTGSPVEYDVGGRRVRLQPRHTGEYETCRSAELVFRVEARRGGAEVVPETFLARDGDVFTLVRDRSGKVSVSRN